MTDSNRRCFILILLLPIVLLLPACAELGPVHRKPLHIQPLESRLPPKETKLLVLFADTIPGKPLVETVWNGASGPFWDANESRQIGFDQDTLKSMPIIMPGPGGTMMAVGGGTNLTDSSIVIPFGRALVEVFQSGLAGAFPNATVCHNSPCATNALQSNQPERMLKIKVISFQAWEKPLNHINLKASVVAMVYRVDQMDKPEYAFEVGRELTNQSVGLPLMSGGVVSEINRITNEFVRSISLELLENLYKKSPWELRP